jgi:hypothetical protein
LISAFGLVFVPARSFQHLLTIELQGKPLEYLKPANRLVLGLFDSRLDFPSTSSKDC